MKVKHFSRQKMLLTAIVMLVTATLFAAKKLKLADFNSETQLSNLGGEFNTWTKDPDDEEQSCSIEFDTDTKIGPDGASLKINYDVKSKQTAFNGVWFKLNQLNLSKYRKLTFWLKGDKKNGFTKTFKIELATQNGRGKVYVNKTKDNWRKISIPLRKFKIRNLRKCDELIFTFEENTTTRQEGTIYIDEIVFE